MTESHTHITKPDFPSLLRALVSADVDFVVVGGLAVRAWGADGHRKDLDIVPSSLQAQLARLSELVVSLNGHAERGGMRVRSSEAISMMLVRGRRLLLRTELGPIDVVYGVEGVPAYEVLNRHAVALDLHGVRVPVCSLEHLGFMKGVADRGVDREDIARLASVTRPRRAYSAEFTTDANLCWRGLA